MRSRSRSRGGGGDGRRRGGGSAGGGVRRRRRVRRPAEPSPGNAPARSRSCSAAFADGGLDGGQRSGSSAGASRSGASRGCGEGPEGDGGAPRRRRRRRRRRAHSPRGGGGVRRRRVRRRRRGGDARSCSDDSSRSPSPQGSPTRRRRRRRRRGNGPASSVNFIPLGERRDGPRGPESTMRVWVGHSDCAKIIGRGGRTMREIEKSSGAKLKVHPLQTSADAGPDTKPKERHVDITGTDAEQKAALDLILEQAIYCKEDGEEGKVLKDTRPVDPGDGKNVEPMVLEVLPEEVGKLLGRKGENIQRIEKESGTKVDVDKATGKVEIQGRVEAQEACLGRVLSELTYAKAADGHILKDEKQQARESAEERESVPPFRLWVRDRDAGKVIGRGGETVREVMEKTGADIKVQKMDEMKDNVGEFAGRREVRIFGTPEQRDKACELILQEVLWARGEEGMLKGLAEEEHEGAKEPARAKATPDAVEDGKQASSSRPSGRARERRGGRRHDRHDDRRDDRQHERGDDRRDDRRDDGGRDEVYSRRDEPGKGVWVCATCGGDHRTKECPHAVGVGMQIGLQMGMQAMMSMGQLAPMPMVPPGAPGMPPMMPGMMGMPPGMMPPQFPMMRGHGGRRGRSCSRSSVYSKYDYSGSSCRSDARSVASGRGVPDSRSCSRSRSPHARGGGRADRRRGPDDERHHNAGAIDAAEPRPSRASAPARPTRAPHMDEPATAKAPRRERKEGRVNATDL